MFIYIYIYVAFQFNNESQKQPPRERISKALLIEEKYSRTCKGRKQRIIQIQFLKPDEKMQFRMMNQRRKNFRLTLSCPWTASSIISHGDNWKIKLQSVYESRWQHIYNGFSKTSDDGLCFRHKDKNKGYNKSHTGRISKECWHWWCLQTIYGFSKCSKKMEKQTTYSLQELVEEQFLWSTLFTVTFNIHFLKY